MPYHLEKQNNRYCVVKDGETTPIPGGCHDTEQEAQDHMAALYANEPDAAKSMDALPALLWRAMLTVKAGQRHSAADQKMLNAMHDMSVDLGASCGGASKHVKAMDAGCMAACQACMDACQACIAACAANDASACVAACQQCMAACQQCVTACQQCGMHTSVCAAACRACMDACHVCASVCAGSDMAACHGCASYCGTCCELCYASYSEPEMAMRTIDGSVSALRTAHGGAIRMLDNGHIGGYLITFGSPEQTDLYGDYFTADTDFGFEGEMKTAVYFNHRLPIKTRAGDFFVIKSRIGEGTLTKDARGILIDAILFNREEYEQALAALGWSSGTAEHLIESEKVGKAYWLKTWPLGLDASITPSPAEPRNAVLPLKSLLGQELIVVIP